MVLLTSSAVSAAISAGVVCIFTFLLFLSGYVLQQQTVRSLQEALRNPPEKPWYPKPVLPPQFREPNENLVTTSVENETIRISDDQQVISKNGKQQANGSNKLSTTKQDSSFQEHTPLQLWREYVARQQAMSGKSLNMLQDGVKTSAMEAQDEADDKSIYFQNPPERETLAYILTIPSPSDLCSAAVFVKQHRSDSRLDRSPPSIVLIYPATWEVSDNPAHIEAMDLIRDLQEKSNMICHPVSISRVWAGIEIESQLLAELQRTRWAYDRAMYLRSPGMVLDIHKLDRALVKSLSSNDHNSKHGLPRSWTTLSSKTTTSRPAVLLYVHEKGLLAPTAEMKQFAIEVGNNGDDQVEQEPHLESSARAATYLIFDEDDLRRRRQHKTSYAGTIFERFERERRSACSGTTLLKRTRKAEEKLTSRRIAR